MAEWVLGVDGGGTKTLLALANAKGEVLGPFAGAGVNPFDQPRWREELEALWARCPVPQAGIAFASVGLPGVGESASVGAVQLEATRRLAGERSALYNDVALAFVGALAGGPGALVLAGTGSMAWASDGARHLRVGGWGEGFGDEGSAHWIGVQALRLVSWALDGRLEDDAFARGVLPTLGAGDMEGVTGWFYGLEHPRSHVAALARTVDALAEAGNATAQGVLREAAALLAAHAITAWRKLGLGAGARLSYAGSVFNSRTVRDGVRQRLEHLGRWQPPVASPVAGALMDAATNAGWPADESWLRRVQAALEAPATGREPA